MPVTVTPEMVGRTVAVFLAVEGKADTSPSPEQRAFLAAVQQAGGIADVARRVEDLDKLESLMRR